LSRCHIQFCLAHWNVRACLSDDRVGFGIGLTNFDSGLCSSHCNIIKFSSHCNVGLCLLHCHVVLCTSQCNNRLCLSHCNVWKCLSQCNIKICVSHCNERICSSQCENRTIFVTLSRSFMFFTLR
jgi:hypothetical protein